MGRVMSGLGGEIIMNKANEVLKTTARTKIQNFASRRKFQKARTIGRRVVSWLKTKIKR